MIGSVYKVSFLGTDECYVGSTRKTIYTRVYQHIIQSQSNAIRKASCCALLLKYGSVNARIELLEELPQCSDIELTDRERYWIEMTPTCVNLQRPQPAETNQSTSDGEKNYMTVWRDIHREHIKQYDAERRADPEVKAQAAKTSKAWRQANRDKLNANKAERITCEKCAQEMSKGHKHEHTQELCDKYRLRQQDIAKAIELKATGLSTRAIAKHEYFVGRGYNPNNHQPICTLLKS